MSRIIMRGPSQPLEYDAEEVADFEMVERPRSRQDAIGLQQAPPPNGGSEEYGDMECALTQDAYSLLYTADLCSSTFFFAIFVILVQGGMLLVTLIDLVDLSDEPNKNNAVSNRLFIPPGTALTVTLSQFLGMLLIVILMAAEGDVMVGFVQLVEGYDADIQTEMQNATRFRWFARGSLQLLVGVILIADSFILSMQSTSVIDLVLNLTALFFVQEVDEIAFLVADMGLFSNEIQEHCERVKNLKCMAPKSFGRHVLFWKRVLVVAMTIAIITPYSMVVNWQYTGRFLCDTLYIQFGDAYEPSLAYYSGRFDVQGYGIRDLYHERVRYIDETKTLQVAYCNAEDAWTVSRYGPETNKPCKYIFKSVETKTFDVTEVANSPWFYNSSDTGDVPVDWLKVVCNECSEQKCNGTCFSDKDKKSYCNCTEGRSGPFCELTTDCDYYKVDERTIESLATIPGAAFFIKAEFSAITDIDVDMHGRHIYVPIDGSLDAFMLFSGRRWVIYSLPQEKKSRVDQEYFFSFLYEKNPSKNPVKVLKSIKLELPDFKPTFFSTPVNFGGPTYSAVPSSVGWVLASSYSNKSVVAARPNDEQPVSARLLCSDCGQKPDICQNDGVCVLNYCVCSVYYAGFQCERARDCIENGGCYKDLGECNPVSKICDNCRNDSYGNLCQYGFEQLKDPLFCPRCKSYGNAKGCNASTSECICIEGWDGDDCGNNITGYDNDNYTDVDVVI